MFRPAALAALALLPGYALAQPATLTPRGAVPAASGLVLVPGDSVTVMHNGVATTTLLPSLGAFLGAAPPLASNAVAGLMRGDGSTLTVDPLTGIASVVGAATTPLTGSVLSTDTFLIVRGSGTSAVPYSVTPAQLTAALGGLADGTTLSWNATTHQLGVIGQTPTAASTVPTLAAAQILLADGTYLTGTTLQALLGVTTTLTPTTPAPTPTATTISFAGAAGTQPTGTAALTSVGSNPPTGMALDGNGNLVLPSQTYAYMLFEGAGTHGDGTFEIDAAAIRRRTTEMTPDQRVAFAGEGSTPTTLAMSATERAAGDARRLPDDVLQQVQPGDVAGPGNRDFVRGFLQHAVEPGQEGSFVTADGALSQEGASRVRAALVHRAYGDQGLSAALAETTDPTARVMAGAMQDAAGPMARLRSGIQAGQVDPAVDIAPALVEATRAVQQARQRGTSLADAVGQRDAFNPMSSQAEGLLRAAYGPELTGKMSQGQFASLLSDYAQRAREQSTTANLFGANMSADELLQGSVARYGKVASAGSQDATVDAVPAGPVAGSGGRGSGGFGYGPAGSAAPEGGAGQRSAPAARVLETPSLAPNFDAAAAERYAAARQATQDRAGTFKNASGVGQVLQPGATSGSFRMADHAVPSAIVKVGSAGADTARAYLNAGGTAKDLADAAAFSLRQTAMRDGTLDPAAYAKWARDRQGFLSQIPDAAARFGAAADAAQAARAGGNALDAHLAQAAKVAERTVNNAMAARATAIKASQDGVVKGFLGGADPVQQVGAILKSRTAEQDAAQLGRLTANDPDARAGLRRAVAEYILRDLKGNAGSATGLETALNGNGLQTFLRNSGPALRHIMAPADMQALQGVADNLASAGLSRQRGGVGAAPDTGQATSFLQRAAHEMFGVVMGGGPGAAIGSAVAGPLGATVGAGMGAAVGKALQAAREAGIKNTDHLVSQALLDPVLMRVLLAKATPQNQASLMGTLASRLRQVSLVSAVQGPAQDDQRRRQAVPAFAVQHNDLAGLAPHAASYAGVPVNSLLR